MRKLDFQQKNEQFKRKRIFVNEENTRELQTTYCSTYGICIDEVLLLSSLSIGTDQFTSIVKSDNRLIILTPDKILHVYESISVHRQIDPIFGHDIDVLQKRFLSFVVCALI